MLHDTAFANLIHHASGGKLYRHPEEKEDFVVPEQYKLGYVPPLSRKSTDQTAVGEASRQPKQKEIDNEDVAGTAKEAALEKGQQSPRQHDFIVVDWYSDTDPANPHNWPYRKKVGFVLALCWVTFVVYMGASVISPGAEDLIQSYGVSEIAVRPLSEIPAIGRSPLYVVSFVLLFLVQFAGIWTPTFGGLLAVRFLTGFLASPALATGAASIQDILDQLHVPIGFILWVVSAYQGPGLGPVIVGYAVQDYGSWRWSIAIHQIFVTFSLVIVLAFLPETSGPNILARRAQRLRRLTGNDKLRSAGEIEQADMKPKAILFDAIIKPFEITLRDPSIAFCNVYVSLLSFYYLFFAAFPIIFLEEYGFPLANGQLPYISIAVGGSLFAALYAALYIFVVIPTVEKNGPGEPEDALVPALPASILSAGSLFAVGWSAGRTHFIVPCIFTAIFAGANFVVLQPIFAWLSMAYPKYSASLFAANDAMRSTLAFALLIAGTPLFRNLGIGLGSTVTGALTAACIPGVFILWKFGAKLRARSTFAQ